MSKKLPTGVEINNGSIRISFMFEGKRHRETVAFSTSNRDIKHAETLRAKVLADIKLGTFNYLQTFPDSVKGRAEAAAARTPTLGELVMPIGLQGQRFYVGDGSQVANDYQAWLETTQKQKIDLAKSAIATKAQPKAIRFVVVGDFYKHRSPRTIDETGKIRTHLGKENHIRTFYREFLPLWHNIPVSDITVGMIEAYCTDRQTRNTTGWNHTTLEPALFKTVKGYLNELREFFKWCVNNRILTNSPMQYWEANKVKDGTVTKEEDINPFEVDEIDKLRAAIPKCKKWEGQNGEQFLNYFDLQLFTGMRPGELIGLQWSDVSFETTEACPHGYIDVKHNLVDGDLKSPKTEAGKRRIRLVQQARAALAKQREMTGWSKGHVFLKSNNEPYRRTAVMSQDNWKPLFMICDVPYRPMYQLRHTFASRLIKGNATTNGLIPNFIAKQLGHASVRTTLDIYAKLFDSMEVTYGAQQDEILAEYS